MKFGVLGDIHANLEALTVVLEHFKQQQVERIYCLGDIVGYNADPGECIDLLRANGAFCISGNHDRFTCGEIDAVIRPETRRVIEYTRGKLSKEQMQFIASLPDERYFQDIFLFVHGSPRHKDEYINSLQIARSNLQILRKDCLSVYVCFYGHTHLPYLIASSGIETDIHRNRSFELDRKFIYLANVGSVGQPRDQCPLASCATFDTRENRLSYWRLPYNFELTQKKIVEAGLDQKLADRLARGR